jgi:peptidoglycan/LPS O-acetylase OafA/YrhL
VGPNDITNGPWLQPLPNFLDQFAIGMALAVISVWLELGDRTPRWVDTLRRHDWIGWLFAAIAFWIVSTRIGFTGRPFEGASRREFLGRHELYSLVALGLVVSAIFAVPGKGLAGRVLGNRVLTYLGVISYGIYLYHFAVVHQLNEWIGHSIGGPVELQLLLNAALAVLGAALIASISYYVVERPALRLKRLVSPPVPAERGEATAEPAPPLPAP